MDAEEVIDVLEDAANRIEEILSEVEVALRGHDAELRADAYWIAHIKTALRKETAYLGGSMVTLEDTINELKESVTG